MLRVLLALALVGAAACTESTLDHEATGGFDDAVVRAEEIINSFPPLCDALRTQGYETRKATFDDADVTQVRLATDACPDDVARLRSARRVEEAAATVDADAVEVAFTRCAGTRTGFAATIELTNTSQHPLGVVVVVRSTVEGKASGLGATTTAWQIAPGDTVRRRVEAPTRGGDACAVAFSPFLADPGLDGDASGIAPPSEAVASDDVDVWLPALRQAETAWVTAAELDLDAPATTEDLRSIAYHRLVDQVRAGEINTDVAPGLTVCSSQARPDHPRLVSFLAVIDGRLMTGAARRGEDGAWRLLGTAVLVGTTACPGP